MRNLPAPCQTLPGSLTSGAACAVDSQCAGTHCRVAPGALCGLCTSPAPAGAACSVDGDCASGMTCLSESCVVFGVEGAACSATAPCRPDLGCVGGQCGTPSGAGTACATSAECDQLHGVYCNGKACATVGFAQAGGMCGLVDGGLVGCTGPGGFCSGAAAPTFEGSCLPFAPDGKTCDTDAGPLCDFGAVCAGGRARCPIRRAASRALLIGATE